MNPADPFARHLRRLLACRDCATVEGRPVTGAVPGAKIMLVGQAPGPREGEAGMPFAWTAGQRLFSWFETLGVSEAEFRARIHMCAVVRCFPGRNPNGKGDRVPSKSEIETCRKYLEREIEILSPQLLIAVGTLAAAQFLEQSALAMTVGRLHRAIYAGHAVDVAVLPHPSGRSTWLNNDRHRNMLETTLALIAAHAAFRQTFR